MFHKTSTLRHFIIVLFFSLLLTVRAKQRRTLYSVFAIRNHIVHIWMMVFV